MIVLMNIRIKTLRNELALSQEDFAKSLNLSRNFVWMIEKGEREPSDRTILDICRIYHVNENWLRTGEGDIFQERTRETEINEMVDAMYKTDENDFRYQLMKLIAQLKPDQIHTLREIVEELNKNIL